MALQTRGQMGRGFDYLMEEADRDYALANELEDLLTGEI